MIDALKPKILFDQLYKDLEFLSESYSVDCLVKENIKAAKDFKLSEKNLKILTYKLDRLQKAL